MDVGHSKSASMRASRDRGLAHEGSISSGLVSFATPPSAARHEQSEEETGTNGP